MGARLSKAVKAKGRIGSVGRAGRSILETIGQHPLATGLLAILGILGFAVSVAGYSIDRQEADATTEQITNVQSSIESVTSRLEEDRNQALGAYQDGVFLYEDPVEGVYSNFWTAYLMRMDPSPHLTVRGEGKTVEFSGVITLNCENGRYLWETGSDFGTPIAKAEIDDYVPQPVHRAMYRIFCWDKE